MLFIPVEWDILQPEFGQERRIVPRRGRTVNQMITRARQIRRWPVSGLPLSPSRPRRQENPLLSPRLGPVSSLPPVSYPARSWYVYHGYPRPVKWAVRVPLTALPAPEPVHWRRLVPKFVFPLLPGLLYPLFFRWGSLLYPRLPLAGKALRPPTPTSFFPEMLTVILASASVVFLQAAFALIFFRKGKESGAERGIRWGEASAAGGLLAAGVYGVLRGFQYRPDDFLFLPPFALAAAIFSWILIAGTGFFSPRNREQANTPGPIRTADTRFRKPVLYPSELQGQLLISQ